jgi:diacylglycerol kinase (ATP)
MQREDIFTKFVAMKKFIRGFGYAFKGLQYATATQLNFRVHLVATLIALYTGYALHISTNEWLWIILGIALVLITELLNTAIEFLTNLVSPDYNELAGHVKDVSAGAVLVCAIFALITGCIIFIPKLLLLIQHAT